jgi:hypothetical protein
MTDGLGSTATQTYDVRVIAPPPQDAIDQFVLKAGQSANLKLSASGGSSGSTWTLVSGALPNGIALTADGSLTGTPTADAAELNEDGRYTNLIEVADSFTDRVTGAPSPRKATNIVTMTARLSYLLNIRGPRPNGPALRETCFFCHGPGFPPDFEAQTALAIIDVNSGTGFECGTSYSYVARGDLANSLIYQKISATPPCGERMPYGGPYLSEQRIGRVARWIREMTDNDTD